MSDRNDNRDLLVNDSEEYSVFLKKRGLQSVQHLSTMKLYELETYEKARLQVVKHVIEFGDRMFKLSHKYYGDTQYWWLIAWYNKRPTDFHLKPGDTVEIPLPLKDVLYLATKDE